MEGVGISIGPALTDRMAMLQDLCEMFWRVLEEIVG
jgi:hypothetical protein